MIEFVTGDTGSAIELSCIDDLTDDPIDLSNKLVTIKWKQNRIVHAQEMQVIDPINGLVRYRFQDSELESGNAAFDIIITDITTQERITNKDAVRVTVRQRV